MSSPKRRFFSGNTIEQALVAAASHFEVDPERLAYRQVEKRHGFVRVQRRVVIEVDPEHPLRGEAVPAAPPRPASPVAKPATVSAPVPERPRAAAPPPGEAVRRERTEDARRDPAPERPPEDLLPAAQRALEAILRLAGLELRGELRAAAGQLEVELSGADRARVLGEEGELLQAIEYLLPRVIRGAAGESIACRVDCGGFRGRREDELQELARRTADAVRASGRPVLLDPLSPAERRIVHLALAADPEVETASEGDSYFKRITIRKAP
jgi:spoIIIJ-associated protein